MLEVDWNDEMACFDGVCRELADFFAYRMSQASGSIDGFDNKMEDDEVKREQEEEAFKENQPSANFRRCKLPWEWNVEHVILPAIRTALLPPKDFCFPDTIAYGRSASENAVLSPALLKLTSLPDLYKVFERC